tara:strand:- start:2736 stop:3938 length:1203 start_codon:yes stop_codon:yes gene_type:complete
MDLNINNYNTQELLQIFDINIKTLNFNTLDINLLQKQLNKKIEKLKAINNNDFADNEVIENKTQLIDFFYKCFIKLTNEIKDNTNNVIQQDSHFLINHNENNKNEVFKSNVKGGIINPLTIKTLKKVININTRFRDNYNNTNSSDFIINLPYTLKKVLNLRVINYQLPYTVYTVSNKLGSNCFYVNDTLILLSNGSYDSESIVEEINFRMQENKLDITLEYINTSGKMLFTSNNDTNFTLNFNYFENTDMNYNLSNIVNKDQLTLGWLLGFRGNHINKKLKNYDNFNNIYKDFSSYESESIYDNMGNNYFLLSINDFQNNHDTMFISPFKYQSLADNNILAKISSNCCDNKYVQYPKRIYFGPTDINKFHIKIYDEFGRIIDVNNADLSIELECEILYDL